MSKEQRQNLEFLKIQHRAFTIWGLDIGAAKGKGFIRSVWKFLFGVLCISVTQYGFYSHVVHNITNIDMVTSELSMFNQGILLLFKIIMFVIKKDAVLNLIWEMNLLAQGVKPSQYNKWISENERGEFMTKCYLFACLTSASVVFVVPLIMLGYGYFMGMGFNLNMPFEVLFSFDDGSAGYDVFVYVLIFLHIRPLMCSSIGIDTLFGWYIHAVSGHFRVMRIKIEEMGLKITLDNNHGEFVRDVGSFVRYHNKTLQFVEDLNYLFGEILWAEVTLSCLQICFMLYTLSNERSAEKTPFHLLAFLAITLQLVIYCFGGEKIKNENDMLCHDIYMKTPWEELYPSERKLMLLPLIRAQRETSLIGLFFNLNRNLLIYIFKTAFSFITLLGAIQE